MPLDISEKVQQWALGVQDSNIDYNDIHATIEDLTIKRFHQYIPTSGPHPDFRARLENWLEQAAKEEDKKLLFQLVPHIFFIGREEFNALYRSAFRGPINKWLVEQMGLRFLDTDFEGLLKIATNQTWFCSITDWEIGNFYRINGISGPGTRPDFTSLVKLGSATKVLDFMRLEKLHRIVLVEDFVGSGDQMLGIEPLIKSLPNSISILIVPLVVCPGGITAGRDLEKAHTNLTFAPVLSLPLQSFVNEHPLNDEPILFDRIRELIQRLYLTVSGGAPPHDNTKPYGPFGFARTGGLVVLYSNCPDNTLPVIHYQEASSNWRALFPRISRLKL